MRKVLGLVVVVLAAGVAEAAIFERYLSPERPADRAILAYLEREKQGTATSRDLAELGVLLLDKGFPTDAERYLEKALKKDPTNFEARYRLGLVLQRQGRDRAATRLYKRVLKERPGHGYARFMLAFAEERCGRRRAAIKDYAKAYRFAPELANPDANPLIYLSHVQAQAQLARYQKEVTAATLHVAAIDPAAVQNMMKAVAPPPPGETGSPGEAVAAKPEAPAPTPAPTPETTRPRGRAKNAGPLPQPAQPVTGPALAPAASEDPEPRQTVAPAEPPAVKQLVSAPPSPPPPSPTPAPDGQD